jgi:type III secretion system FlhB-like substrate exporter
VRCPLGAQMAQDGTERWRELCAKAAVEEDPDKLYKLIAEILAFFDDRDKQGREKRPLFRD